MVAIEEIPTEVKEGKALWVEIRSPDGMIWSGTSKSVTLPGTLGSMGILPRHAPLVSSLEVGVTRLGEAKAAEGSEGDGTVELVTGLGLVEVYQNQLLQNKFPCNLNLNLLHCKFHSYRYLILICLH